MFRVEPNLKLKLTNLLFTILLLLFLLYFPKVRTEKSLMCDEEDRSMQSEKLPTWDKGCIYLITKKS